MSEVWPLAGEGQHSLGASEAMPVESDATNIALRMMLAHGFAGAVYLAAGYGANEASAGNPENEAWWMRVLVAVVAMRDLPVGWRRMPLLPQH